MSAWLPLDQVVESACTARVDDHATDGGSNLAVDRAVAERLVGEVPEYPGFVVDSRRYTWQAVGAMVDAGIDQFIDLGAGLDAAGIVDELARRSVPGARIAYVETDPVCLAQLESRARDDDRVSVHPIDLFAARWVLDPEGLWRLLDQDRPVGILMPSILHYELSDDVVAWALRDYHARTAAGSMLAVTHLSGDQDPEAATRLEKIKAEIGVQVRIRSQARLVELARPWIPVPTTSDGTVEGLRLGTAVLAYKAKAVTPLARTTNG